jgi:hypothetical protein
MCVTAELLRSSLYYVQACSWSIHTAIRRNYLSASAASGSIRLGFTRFLQCVVWTYRLNAGRFNAQVPPGRTFEVLALVVSRIKGGDELDIDICFREIFCGVMNRTHGVKSVRYTVQCKQVCQSVCQSAILAPIRQVDKVFRYVREPKQTIHSDQVQSGQVGQSGYHCSGMRRRAVCQDSSLLRERQMNLHCVLQILTLWSWMQSLQVDEIFPHD